jgi:nicotinamidase-related amidase
MILETRRSALMLTDLQNDFLNPGGNGWALFADSYARNSNSKVRPVATAPIFPTVFTSFVMTWSF